MFDYKYFIMVNQEVIGSFRDSSGKFKKKRL